jgi:hypothetical protein
MGRTVELCRRSVALDLTIYLLVILVVADLTIA